MNVHLRVARPVTDLPRTIRMYTAGLSLEVLGSFSGHDGFDGVMLGSPGAQYHFEFTYCHRHPVAPRPTPEDLLVFYVPDASAWQKRCDLLRVAGFEAVDSFNPYWSASGCTFADPDGYRIVIQRAAWTKGN